MTHIVYIIVIAQKDGKWMDLQRIKVSVFLELSQYKSEVGSDKLGYVVSPLEQPQRKLKYKIK